jgi:hypothetical protein
MGDSEENLDAFVGYLRRIAVGEAGKLTLGEHETIAEVTAQLRAASKVFGTPLTIDHVDKEVYFWFDNQ